MGEFFYRYPTFLNTQYCLTKFRTITWRKPVNNRMHGQITARMMCYQLLISLHTYNCEWKIQDKTWTSPDNPTLIYEWDLWRLRHISSMALWPIFGPWPPQSWGFGTIYVLQGRVVSPMSNWIASSSCFSPPTSLGWDTIPVTMLLPVQLVGSLKHTIPTTTCKGPATLR